MQAKYNYIFDAADHGLAVLEDFMDDLPPIQYLEIDDLAGLIEPDDGLEGWICTDLASEYWDK